jgi:hypothetical protein
MACYRDSFTFTLHGYDSIIRLTFLQSKENKQNKTFMKSTVFWEVTPFSPV